MVLCFGKKLLDLLIKQQCFVPPTIQIKVLGFEFWMTYIRLDSPFAITNILLQTLKCKICTKFDF